MFEFNSRMRIQRDIIASVNSHACFREQLSGLTEQAIRRWALANSVRDDTDLIRHLRRISDLLFALSEHSQSPISDRYKHNVELLDREKSELAQILVVM